MHKLIVAAERITDAEATAERQKKLAVRENHSQGRYELGKFPAVSEE